LLASRPKNDGRRTAPAQVEAEEDLPVLGDAFDVMWRSNRRNMRLLQDWLAGERGMRW
jgi:hypothetical protein